MSSVPLFSLTPPTCCHLTGRYASAATPRFGSGPTRSPPSPFLLFPSVGLGVGTCVRPRRRISAGAAVAAAFDYSLLRDVGATAVVLGGAYALIFTTENLTKRNLIPQSLSRKCVHILSGLLFVLSWPIFSASTEARYFAVLAPLVNCLRLIINGLSETPDDSLIKSVTREGKPNELLKGPLYYVLVLIFFTIVFWRDSPTGMISLAMMCGGDGIADIMGRRFGSHKIPYNPRKSWVGSISMFIFGFFISIGMLYYHANFGYLQLVDWRTTIERVAFVSLVATAVESLPIADRLDDNLSVPMASTVVAYLCFGY